MKAREIGREVMHHLQTGVSYMIPLVCAAGLLMSIGSVAGGNTKDVQTIWDVCKLIGQLGLGFIPPMLSAYMAYSIADRPGLAPGFITGLLVNQMGAGFLGGIVTGLGCGYLAREFKKIPIPTNIAALKSMMIIPICTTFIVGVIFWYVIGSPIAWAQSSLTAWLKGMTGVNGALLGAIVGAMMAFDMGGPLNKIAYSFGVGAFSEGVYSASTVMYLAIGIPPTIMFLATLLNKKLYTQEERDQGITAVIMGLVGITEGTIPFAIKDPLRVIPSIIVGTAVSCGMCGFFGITNTTAMSTFKAIPFVDNIPLYLLCIAIGSLVGALMVNALKAIKSRAGQKGAEVQSSD